MFILSGDVSGMRALRQGAIDRTGTHRRWMVCIFLLALVWVLARPVWSQTTTLAFQNDYRVGGYTGIMDTWLWSAYTNNSKGASDEFWVGEWINWGPKQRGMMRIDLSSLHGAYTTLTGARLKLKVKSVDAGGGNWTNQSFNLYRVAPANKAWASGTSGDGPQNGAACWNYLSYSSVIDPITGELGGTRWAGALGCDTAGTDYLATPVATATLNYDVSVGSTVTWTFTDTSYLDDWIANPANNAGFIMIAPGLENDRLGSIHFYSSDTATQADRPSFEVDLTGYIPAPGTAINYTLPAAGRVSLNIYDGNGQVVRELLHADPQAAGAHRLVWDNQDRDGNRVANGNYTWKILVTPDGLTARYIMSVGTTVTPDYDLYTGNDEGPRGLAVDATGMYLAGGVSEGPHLVIKQDATGARLWTYHNWVETWQGGQSMAVMNGVLYMVQQNGKITRFNASTGALIGTWDTAYAAADHNGLDWANRYDIAANGGKLVISCPSHNAIRWLSTTDGSVLQEVAVANPQGVTLAPNGIAYVASGTQVVANEFGNSGTSPTITANLVKPWRLTYDATTGNLLVFDGGSSQQVKRFTTAGALLASYGRAGGRQQGLYNGNDFQGVTAIAAAPDGTFWVTECYSAPRRSAHFSATGQLIKDFYGGQTYSVYATPDPASPTTLVWMNAGNGSVLQLQTDFVNKTWSVRATYQMSTVTLADGAVLPGPPISRGHGFSEDFVRVLHRNGQTYLCLDTYGPQVQRVDETNRKLWTVVTSGNVGDLPTNLKPADQTLVKFMWNDLDGNGQPVASELNFLNHNLVTSSWSGGYGSITNDFTYFLNLYPADCPSTGAAKLVPRGWTAGDTPIYHWADLDYTCTDGIPSSFQHHAPYSVQVDGNGNIYHIYNLNCTYLGGTGGGNGFWSNRNGDCKLVKWNAAGARQWAVGTQSRTGGADAGEMRYVWRILNVINDCPVIQDQENGLYHVWDPDGLWVGRLLDHQVDAEGVPAKGDENWGSTIARDASTGKVYFFNSSANSHNIFEITGWENWTRLNGTVSVSEPYGESPVTISDTATTRIEAENFDKGGEGVAYHDTGTGNAGGAYRTTEDVDIFADANCSNGQSVGAVNAGEWMKYTIGVPTAGPYTLTVRAAAWGGTTQCHLVDEDGNNLTGTLTLTETYGSGTYGDTSIGNIALTAGVHVLKLIADTGNLNFDYISFTPGATATGTGTGLCGTYFSNMALTTPAALTRLDPQVNFDWGAGAPGGTVPADLFSVRWTGKVQATVAGAYTFSTTSDDGVRLWVNGQQVINNWTDHGQTTDTSAAITLAAGQMVDVTMEFYENGGGAVAKLLWTPPGGTLQAIPQAQLYPSSLSAGLTGSYFSNQTLTAPATLTRTESQVNFNWGTGSPDSTVPADHFSARWTGKVLATVAGNYTFSTISDDGVRLSVNGQQVINNWTDHGPTTDTSASITLVAGQLVDVTMEFYENGGGAVAQLLWTPPSGTLQAIPASQLFTAVP